MIINKITKQFMSRSDIPNDNWMENKSEWFVVPDGSPLANEIISCGVEFDLVVDEEGNLVGIHYDPIITQDEINVDLDFRLCMLELGLI